MNVDDGKIFSIPFQVGPGHYSLMVVLMDESIARIMEYDPAEITMEDIRGIPGEPYRYLTLKDVIITRATHEEMHTVTALIKEGRARDGLRLLTRGYRYRREAGDGLGPTIIDTGPHS